MASGGMLAGNLLEAELGYGMPVETWLVGTPRFGVATSTYGRDYRLGYGLRVLQVGATSIEFGVGAGRRETTAFGSADHGALSRLTASWYPTRESSGGNGTSDGYGPPWPAASRLSISF